jgi:hypothetical protein
MTVVYFTDGALIEDVRVRRLLLRIPEVLSTLRDSSQEFVNCDLFLVMNEKNNFDSMNYHQKEYLKTILQAALYERWRSQGRSPDLILRRKDYNLVADLKCIFKKLATIDSLRVVTIGPGYDEMENFLRRDLLISQSLNDTIAVDPALNWFWADLKSELQFHS